VGTANRFAAGHSFRLSSRQSFVIYFDYNATTPELPEVFEAMRPYFCQSCLADSDGPSHVVKAMKPESAASRQMIRFSLDAANTMTEVKNVISGIQGAVKMLRD
jgi:cysteine sulfinate desulfinase/cysteine desulfurase-like protein